MLAAAVAAATALGVLSGCDAGGGQAAAPQPSASSNQSAALELARCMRAHGFPDFPDPVRDDQGRWDFPPSAGDWRPPNECRDLVPGWKIAFSDEQAMTPQEMTKRRQYSACMREHGLPDFPDPDENGNFPLPDRIRQMEGEPSVRAAEQACAAFAPAKDPAKG